MKKILISQIADLHLQLRRLRVDDEVRRRVDDVVSSRSSSSSRCSCRHVNAQIGDGVAGGRVLGMWMVESGWSRGNSLAWQLQIRMRLSLFSAERAQPDLGSELFLRSILPTTLFPLKFSPA